MEIFLNIVTFLKRHRDSLPIVISCLALLLTGINIYWTFLKDRKVLHLIYIDKLAPGMEPQFAVVNGGKSDILITDLSCSFQYTDNTKSAFTPSQTIEWKEGDSCLLPSGKGFYYKVKFNEKFTSTFVQKGRLETLRETQSQLYMHDMYVNISWVEMDGRCFNKSIKLIKYGFNDEGEIMHRVPISFRKPIDLYKAKS